MIDGSEKRNLPLAFELQNSHVCEVKSAVTSVRKKYQSDKFLIRAPYRIFKNLA